MSSSNCGFLTCIQVSQEAGKVVRYSNLFKNCPQFVVIHTLKSFSIVNEEEVGVFLEFLCFLYDPTDVGNLNQVLQEAGKVVSLRNFPQFVVIPTKALA